MRNIVLCSFLLCILSAGLYPQKATVLYSQKIKHIFSSQKKADAFSISAYGQNIFDSYVAFRIVRWDGKEIYKHRFSMGDLMEYGPPETDKAYRRDSKDSSSIIRHLSHFFDEDQFHNPAIADTIDMRGNMLPRDKWWNIWKDKTAIGFFYELGAEDMHGIVFSKRHKKVIQYYACC